MTLAAMLMNIAKVQQRIQPVNLDSSHQYLEVVGLLIQRQQEREDMTRIEGLNIDIVHTKMTMTTKQTIQVPTTNQGDLRLRHGHLYKVDQ